MRGPRVSDDRIEALPSLGHNSHPEKKGFRVESPRSAFLSKQLASPLSLACQLRSL